MRQDKEKNMKEYAKRVLKSEIGRTLIDPAELAEKLELGTYILNKKISRGNFSAGFFFQVLQELGTKEVPVPSKEDEDNK